MLLLQVVIPLHHNGNSNDGNESNFDLSWFLVWRWFIYKICYQFLFTVITGWNDMKETNTSSCLYEHILLSASHGFLIKIKQAGRYGKPEEFKSNEDVKTVAAGVDCKSLVISTSTYPLQFSLEPNPEFYSVVCEENFVFRVCLSIRRKQIYLKCWEWEEIECSPSLKICCFVRETHPLVLS